MPIELISVLLLMGLSAALAAWFIDHIRLTHLNAKALEKTLETNSNSLSIASQIQTVHNEQAKDMIRLGQRVEEISSKVEMSSLFQTRKPFKEEVKK